MINSLSKDSHITQSTCRPKSSPSGRSAHTSERSSVPLNNSDIFVNNNKPADISFSGFFRGDASGPAKIFTSKSVKNLITMAVNKPALLNAVFALGLTCFLRPATIMALPANKKNKDDKKYAAAHSIASGVIGYVIALAIFNPISKSFKKIIEHPEKFPTKRGLDYLKDDAAQFAVKKYSSQLSETLFAAPRAIVTVALIPPILKYVFGWEKKKGSDKKDIKPTTPDYSLLNFKSSTESTKNTFPNFKGGVK